MFLFLVTYSYLINRGDYYIRETFKTKVQADSKEMAAKGFYGWSLEIHSVESV